MSNESKLFRYYAEQDILCVLAKMREEKGEEPGLCIMIGRGARSGSLSMYLKVMLKSDNSSNDQEAANVFEAITNMSESIAKDMLSGLSKRLGVKQFKQFEDDLRLNSDSGIAPCLHFTRGEDEALVVPEDSGDLVGFYIYPLVNGEIRERVEVMCIPRNSDGTVIDPNTLPYEMLLEGRRKLYSQMTAESVFQDVDRDYMISMKPASNLIN